MTEEIHKKAVDNRDLVLQTQKDERCDEYDGNMEDGSNNQQRCVSVNSAVENTNPTGHDTTEDDSDTATSYLKKKKKKLTKFREKEMKVSDESSNSEIDETPPQHLSRHKRRKKTLNSDDNHSDDSMETPGTLQEIRNSFGTTEEYIDDLLSFLKYNIKYVTDQELKQELNQKMINLEMEHKRKQNDLEGC